MKVYALMQQYCNKTANNGYGGSSNALRYIYKSFDSAKKNAVTIANKSLAIALERFNDATLNVVEEYAEEGWDDPQTDLIRIDFNNASESITFSVIEMELEE